MTDVLRPLHELPGAAFDRAPALTKAQAAIEQQIRECHLAMQETEVARSFLRIQIVLNAWVRACPASRPTLTPPLQKQRTLGTGLAKLGPLATATHKRQAGLNVVRLDELLLKLDAFDDPQFRPWRKATVKRIQNLLIRAEHDVAKAAKLVRFQQQVERALTRKRQSPSLRAARRKDKRRELMHPPSPLCPDQAGAASLEPEQPKAHGEPQSCSAAREHARPQEPQPGPPAPELLPPPEHHVDDNAYRTVIWILHPDAREARVTMKQRNLMAVSIPGHEELLLSVDPANFATRNATSETKDTTRYGPLLSITLPKIRPPPRLGSYFPSFF
jgi:hypothetical protein